MSAVIRELRVYSKMTQADIAKKLGVSPQFISLMELGKTPIPKYIAEGYAKIFGKKKTAKK